MNNDTPNAWQSALLQNVAIPMRDGIKLAADISFPSEDGVTAAQGKYPTLLVRTPYSKAMMRAMPAGLVATGSLLSPAQGKPDR